MDSTDGMGSVPKPARASSFWKVKDYGNLLKLRIWEGDRQESEESLLPSVCSHHHSGHPSTPRTLWIHLFMQVFAIAHFLEIFPSDHWSKRKGETKQSSLHTVFRVWLLSGCCQNLKPLDSWGSRTQAQIWSLGYRLRTSQGGKWWPRGVTQFPLGSKHPGRG